MKKISFKFIAFAMALSICFSVVYSDYSYALDLPKFVYDDDKTLSYNAINLISLGCEVGGFVVGPGNPVLAFGLEGSALIGKFFLHLMDTYGWGDKPKEEQDELIKDYLKNAVTYNTSTKQYIISDSFNDDLHIVVNNYMKESTGYYYYQVPTLDDIAPSFWKNKTGFDRLKTIVSDYDCVYLQSMDFKNGAFSIAPVDKPVYTNKKDAIPNLYGYKFIDSDWKLVAPQYLKIINDSKAPLSGPTYFREALCLYDYDYLKDIDYVDNVVFYGTYGSISDYFYLQRGSVETGYIYQKGLNGIFSLEPFSLRVWYDMDKYRSFDLGKQPYYASQEWNNYDYSQDNSQTYSESFIDNSIKDSNNNTTYNEIVNNTTNGMTEKEVADLVETIMKNQKEINNTPPSSGGDNTGGGSSSGGSGLGVLLDGIGGLLDFIVTLIGNVVSMITDTLTTILNSFSGFTNLFSGFTEFLSSAFAFVPEEVWTILISGCSVMVVLAIIKFLKG